MLLRENQDINHVDSNYIMNTVVMNHQGQTFPLSLFAQQRFTGEAPRLMRWKGYNSNIIKADVKQGVKAANIIESVLPKLNKIAEQYQITLELGGEAEETSSSNDALLKTLPIGAILLFSGLIMLTIPLAMIGVKPTLALVGVNFGFMSVLGLLALTGIVVNTAIILIDTVLVKIKEDNAPLSTAIELATKERFRPVLLTACTTIIGMIPLTSPSSPLWPPMAWTIIGGLITSTILTLIVLPACLKLTLSEDKIRGNQV